MNPGDIVKLKGTVINWFPNSNRPRTGIIVKKDYGNKPWHRRYSVMFSDGSCYWVTSDVIERV